MVVRVVDVRGTVGAKEGGGHSSRLGTSACALGRGWGVRGRDPKGPAQVLHPGADELEDDRGHGSLPGRKVEVRLQLDPEPQQPFHLAAKGRAFWLLGSAG